MNTTQKTTCIIGLAIALAAAFPASADAQGSTPKKSFPAAKPVSAKVTTRSRIKEDAQRQEDASSGATQQKDDTPPPGSMPYVTYDGAENSGKGIDRQVDR